MTPYSDITLGPSRHWLRQLLVTRRYQTITWTNVDISLVRFRDNHLRAFTNKIWGVYTLQCAVMRDRVIRTLGEIMKLFYGSNVFPQTCFRACSLYSVTNCKYHFTGMITTMSYWMQILDLRWPKLIYWTVHVVLTHDLDECQKTLMRSQH